MHFTVTEIQAGTRLDKILGDFLPDFTRNFIQKLIKEGKVSVNKKVVQKASLHLQINDEIQVQKIKSKEAEAKPEKIPLQIIYEDKDILIINKPAGMVVHPTETGDHQTGTIVNAVLHHCQKDLSGIGGVNRPGILHRLDKDTSGILTIAKNDPAHQFLSKQIHDREVQKFYLVLVQGHIHPQKGSIDAPIFRSPKDRKKMDVSAHSKARNALTHYEVLEEYAETSLLKVQIVTGRTHQIRVHFASIGFPVVGDDLYGDFKFNAKFKKEFGLKRQFLHALKIGFKLPSTQKWREFEAPLSGDLEGVKNLLF